ncbi:hypothetical protein [Streptosporangium sp. 'caverna']|uniref:hypothetical protein n=1 Tax=Streptosporangium sp. 'caverna' TaxID=2202249 RepID=UPI000D7D7B16|nr:hypothetical protein [Streptosporangium sp. 'caverna']AWS44527.1 hypothetical protein DKM19_27435 [Streptosporangium sp. 'caverna']
MLISTLPDLAGRTFEVRGFVLVDAQIAGSWSTDRLYKKVVQQLSEQAGRLGADGIVDVKTVMSGGSSTFVITGTAVKLQG